MDQCCVISTIFLLIGGLVLLIESSVYYAKSVNEAKKWTHSDYCYINNYHNIIVPGEICDKGECRTYYSPDTQVTFIIDGKINVTTTANKMWLMTVDLTNYRQIIINNYQRNISCYYNNLENNIMLVKKPTDRFAFYIMLIISIVDGLTIIGLVGYIVFDKLNQKYEQQHRKLLNKKYERQQRILNEVKSDDCINEIH